MTQQFAGKVEILNSSQQATIVLDGNKRSIDLKDVILRDQAGNNMMSLVGATAEIYLGAKGTPDGGQMYIRNKEGKDTIHIHGNKGVIDFNRGSIDGENGVIAFRNLILRDESNKDTVALVGSGEIYVGDNGHRGVIYMRNSVGSLTITINGEEGDVILQNADCAEDFEVMETEAVNPGTVMVIDSEGRLRQSTEAYDKKVAGVISGAGDLKPGMVLGRQPSQSSRMPISLMGKVYCKVDAQYSPIEVGDLLTTSHTPGHAMKATDSLKAFGAVIGKALRPLNERAGLIPILIALQ